MRGAGTGDQDTETMRDRGETERRGETDANRDRNTERDRGKGRILFSQQIENFR